MMRLFLSFLFILYFQNIDAQSTSTYLDFRDNTSYATVEVAGQTWFQENIRYETKGCFCKGRKKKAKTFCCSLCKELKKAPSSKMKKLLK